MTGPQENPNIECQRPTVNVHNVNKVSHIKVMYTNIDGISNKTFEFSNLVSKEKPHVVCTETKLCPTDISAEYFKIANYMLSKSW